MILNGALDRWIGMFVMHLESEYGWHCIAVDPLLETRAEIRLLERDRTRPVPVDVVHRFIVSGPINGHYTINTLASTSFTFSRRTLN